MADSLALGGASNISPVEVTKLDHVESRFEEPMRLVPTGKK